MNANQMVEALTNPPLKTYYRFYVEDAEGNEIEWRGLTHKQARDMYAYTDARPPLNVTRYGWGEIK
jgi:hypothetical protein